MTTIGEGTRLRSAWDIFILTLIMFSCVLVPYQIAFGRQVDRAGSALVYIIDLMFLLDIGLNFRTSFRHKGSEITEGRLIRRHYFRTMFPIDLVASFPFDLLLLAWPDVTFHGLPVVLLLRSLRLLRVVRLIVLFYRWENRSWTNSSRLRIIEFLLLILLLTHWVACAWFFVPFLEGFPPDSWTVREGITAADPATQYIRSLYWTIVTMTTVGYGDITPTRNVEYIFTMIVMIMGASIYAFIIGNIASLFSNWDSAKASFWSRVDALNQYLRSRGVPAHLNEQVRDYYGYLWFHYRGLMQDDLFADLPAPVRLELVLHLTKNLLEKVPIFRHCKPALRNALLMKLEPQVFGPGSYIVREGETGNAIIFISRGRAEILSGDTDKLHGEFEEGDSFGYLSMALEEKLTASVRAITYCDLFILPRQAFAQIRGEFPEFREVLKKVSSDRTEKMEALIMEGVIL